MTADIRLLIFRLSKACRTLLFGAILMAAGIFPGHAAVLFWTGGPAGGDGNWSNPFNWAPTQTPANGDTVLFPAFALHQVNTNNIVGLTLSQICFAGPAGGYDISGNAFTLTNGIEATNTAGVNIIENNITLAGADQTVEVSQFLTSDGIWSGNVGVVKTGSGTLTYSGDHNAYTGTTTVNAGLLQLDCFAFFEAFAGPLAISGATVRDLADEEIPSNVPITINGGGTLDLNNLDDQVGGALTLNGNGNAINGNPFSLNGIATVTCSPGFLQSCTISGSLLVGSTACAFNVNGSFLHGSLLVPANVSGSGVITKTGNWIMTLSGSNSFSSELDIAAGTVGVSSPFALGLTNGITTVSNTATLVILSSVTNESLTVASTGIGIQNGSGANTWAGDINLAVASTFEIDGTSLNLLSTISGVGGFTKTGAGTLILSGPLSNTYGGTTTVNVGLLQLSKLGVPFAATAIPGDVIVGDGASSATMQNLFNIEVSPAANVTVNSNAVWDMNSHNDHIGVNLTLNGNSIVENGTGLTLLPNATITANEGAPNCVLSGPVNISSGVCSLIVNDVGGGGFFDIPGNIGGSATINKTGNGFVSLDGTNTFTGQLNILDGKLEVFNSFALGSTNGGTTVSNTASLWVDFSITNEPLTIASTGIGLLNPSRATTWIGPAITLATTTTTEIDGPLFDIQSPITGAGGFTKTGAGTLSLSGSVANTYAGLTTVNAGTLLLNKSSFVNAVAGNISVGILGTLRLGNTEQIADTADVLVNGLFDFASSSESIDTLHGTGNITFGTPGFLNIGANNGTSTFDGIMSGTGFPSGYTVGKMGSGTFTMTGNNTYSEGSDVLAGKLIINGNQPQSQIRKVNAGATLGGTGTVGDIVSPSGIVAPGATTGSPGILTTSNVLLTASANFSVELKGPTPGTDYDQLNVRGTNNLANATLTVIPSFTKAVPIGQQFTIINNDGADPIVGTFNGLANGAAFSASGYFFRINYNAGSGNDVVLTLLGVPGNTVTLNAVDRGWYDSTGFHIPNNTNYLCGEIPSGPLFYRNYFVFNSPLVVGQIIQAELLVNCYVSSSPHGHEIYVLHKVTSSISSLEAGGSGQIGFYNDLGDGVVYGVRTIVTNEGQQKLVIPLNANFINDLTPVAGGGQIALGGSIVTLDAVNNSNQFDFAFSGQAPDDVQLRLTIGTSTTLNAGNTGWYDQTGHHTLANKNYFAGNNAGVQLRDFFMYNLPVISGPLVDAQLLVNTYAMTSPTNSDTFQLHDVTTPIVTLTNGATGATGTYADLGDGVLYGGRDIFVSEQGLVAAIPLNTAFITAVNAQSGGQIALGGELVGITTNGTLFSGSLGDPPDAQLRLGFLSAPATIPTLVSGSVSNVGNNAYTFVVSGTAGTSNEIQGSFDLQNWDFVGDMFMTSGNTTYGVTNNTIMPYRFFRAKFLP